MGKCPKIQKDTMVFYCTITWMGCQGLSYFFCGKPQKNHDPLRSSCFSADHDFMKLVAPVNLFTFPDLFRGLSYGPQQASALIVSILSPPTHRWYPASLPGSTTWPGTGGLGNLPCRLRGRRRRHPRYRPHNIPLLYHTKRLCPILHTRKQRISDIQSCTLF